MHDTASGPLALSPGWDRRNPWTLRFVDPELERAYEAAMAAPGTERLRIAHLVGGGIWLVVGTLGPPLLSMPALPFYVAAVINVGWEMFVVPFLTRRPISLARVWATASFTTTLSALCILFAFGTGETFVTVGAAALMTNAAFGIALVRPAGWVAATLGVMTLLLYSIVVLLFDMGGVAVFEALLPISLLSGATLGARYLEEAERNAFAQGFLVADLHRKIDRLFRQYLSPDVAQALVDDPSRAQPRRRGRRRECPLCRPAGLHALFRAHARERRSWPCSTRLSGLPCRLSSRRAARSSSSWAMR